MFMDHVTRQELLKLKKKIKYKETKTSENTKLNKYLWNFRWEQEMDKRELATISQILV